MINSDGSYNYSKVIPVNSLLTDGLSVFPNPVRNKLNINYDASTQGSIISIYTINGQLINSYVVPAQSVQTIIDVSKYSSGSYILVFKSQNNKETRQFIKL
ncbi:MAG: T9SS type A sorting domain-containing protein [Arachidicoccus sp.]|nr:T9SS type A sorting domain-containing protein [Arachidicoccus sp.]